MVRHGSFATGPERDHTVKVDVTGLDPARWYHYRFRWDGHTSRAGRTRTAPAADATPDHLRFGVVSCANLQAGWFSAYRGLAARDDLHAVVHLGDYLYEYGPGEYGYGPDNEDIRKHQPAHEMVSLADYRQRHAQYKTDPDLQDAHAKYPSIVTWDDHEVANDAWKDGAEPHPRPRRRRRGQLQGPPCPRAPGVRRVDARAARRQRPDRGRQPAVPPAPVRHPGRAQHARPAHPPQRSRWTPRAPPAPYPDGEVRDPARTITGEQQLDWLEGSLRRHRDVQWKLIGNPVMIAPVSFGDLPNELVNPVNDVTGLLPANGAPYNVDQWDGYTADRRRVFDFIRNHQVKDTVFITGDIHSGWAAELPYDASTYTGQGPSEDETAASSSCAPR